MSIEPIENNTYRIRRHSVDVEIGNRLVVGFKPHFKLKRWDGECCLDLGFDDSDITIKNVVIGEGKVKWITPKFDLVFYTITPHYEQLIVNKNEYVFLQNEFGGFEFEIILKANPSTYVWKFPIQTKGLEYYYQPPLHPVHPTWVDTNGDGKPNLLRPENVVGSYAVYHAEKRNVHLNDGEATKYRTGKAFHIYRPLLSDALGTWAWATLEVDEEARVLRIILPQEFLENATYPVVVDPTFGYESQGGTNADIDNIIRGTYHQIPYTGTPDKLTAYVVHEDICFDGATLISMADGKLTEIKDVKIGDRVKSYNVEQKEFTIETVTEVFCHPPEDMGEYSLVVDLGDCEINVTPNHLLYADGKWKSAGELEVGSQLFGEDTSTLRVLDIQRHYEKIPTFNLEITNTHTYFAGGILAHNVKPSFPVGTKVLTPDGIQVPIEDIKKGDSVTAFDVERGIRLSVKVLAVRTGTHQNYLCIDHEQGKLRVTEKHKLRVNGKWNRSDEVRVGDELQTEIGASKVLEIKKIEGQIGTFDLTTEHPHTYFADGVLSHNQGANVKGAIYLESDDSFVENTAQIGIDREEGWQDLTITDGATLTFETNYWLVVWGDLLAGTDVWVKYDSNSGIGGYDSETYGTFPDPWIPVSENREYSIYCTYTMTVDPPTVTTQDATGKGQGVPP